MPEVSLTTVNSTSFTAAIRARLPMDTTSYTRILTFSGARVARRRVNSEQDGILGS